MPADEQRIRLARDASNQAIARRDVAGIQASLDDRYQVTTSDGTVRAGREETGAAFKARFAEFPDAVFERIPETVEVSTGGTVAAETGNWTGGWTAGGRVVRTGGRYAARWRLLDERWLIHSELFIPLFHEEAV